MTGSAAIIDLWRASDSSSEQLARDVDALAGVLHAVVHDGAGVSFILPFSMDDARGFWRDTVLPALRSNRRRVLVARLDDDIVGTVQLDLATPPNQRHRAEVMKLLVHPSARRRGIARALMLALEDVGRAERRTLFTLDTWTGGAAERLYTSLGYITVGVIPRFARPSTTTGLEPTTIMYKELTTRLPGRRPA
ncbi:MAG TPA: GNAT family N-acetyltransferase [Vicinamibacterales bacterium]|nr:GNAT family N-acetyltransferase [Vicinamibacterales bacterium]